jgi:hypothetical protein
MSRRPEPPRKRTPDVFADLLQGHEQARFQGPQAARKYLERTLTGQHSLPNAVKFFAWDLLAEAADREGLADLRDEAVAAALAHLEDAQADLPRELQAWLPTVRCFEAGIRAAMDEGAFEQALALCDQAIALGLGRVYEQKAETIRWML